MNLYKKNIRVLVIEPSNQQPKYEKARPNGTLGPAYIVGSLRKHGIETDYLDATVGQIGRNLKETFYLRNEMENGNILQCSFSDPKDLDFQLLSWTCENFKLIEIQIKV